MEGRRSATMPAEALVVFAAAVYLGLEIKVICPGPAVSMPATPVISVSGAPFSSRAPSAAAIAESFMESQQTIVTEWQGGRGPGSGALQDRSTPGNPRGATRHQPPPP